MRKVEELLEQAKRLSMEARRELRDKLDESLSDEERHASEQSEEGPYASLLRSAGTAHSTAPDVARQKNKHLADIFGGKRGQ